MGVMSATLYNATILRLATSIPHQTRLSEPQATVSKRSPICGSRVTVDVVVDETGRVADLGQEVRACALGQAAAALMGEYAIGRSPEQLAAARDALTAFLAGERDDPGDWPGLEIFEPARRHAARHPSIRLAFEAVAEAAAQASAEMVR
ncbi:iron-sulfur cluster assembly scaffold protein [Sphingomonas sp. Root710]|uniref:iron-sulfur cluster assembly scaffold protein n=1 Tax=Sphingomonas sp. Root710 TaxID=1736594 RepID=UPI000B28F53B|nr:iron-sulfur cluster assembly scaffold protein [Sphingomonas sp. Root710]